MKVLHVLIAYYPAVAYGGPIRSVRNLCVALRSQGIESEVCVTDSDGTRTIDVSCDGPRDVEGVPVRYFHSPYFRYFGFSPAMKRWLGSHVADYELVHIHGVWSFPERYAAESCRRRGVPYVVAPRGMLDRTVVDERHPFLKRLLLRTLDRANLECAAAIHYTSSAEREKSVLSGGDAKSVVVANAVAWSAPSERTGTDSSSEAYVLFAGRITWKKRVDVLIRAFAKVAAEHAALKLVIAGPDDEGLTNGLRVLAERCGVGSRVDFRGMVRGEALRGLYRGAHLFVLPSLSENFGHSVAEALSEGIPVVVAEGVDIVSFPEVRKMVAVCRPDPESLAEAMGGVLRRHAEARAAAAGGAALVQRLFSPENIGRQMAEVYRSIVKV